MLGRLGIIAPLFLLSGSTALLYQVAFGKKLSTIFGATAYAVSAVLAAFMAGLAIGSHFGGRYAGRSKRPLVIYGYAEIVVALVCALTPWMFEGVEALYVAGAQRYTDSLTLISMLRSVIAGGVVLVPTVAMGLTLPMLARAVATAEGEGSKDRLARLYAINTAGGAIGALAAAYLVLPTLGVYATMRSAALLNLAIGVVAIVTGRQFEPLAVVSQPKNLTVATIDRGRWHLLIALALASGLLVFSAEVVDTHLLALLIGNSAYAFGLMLAVFLSCLTAGAWLASKLDQKLGSYALPMALALTGVVLITTLPVWGELPEFFVEQSERATSWAERELVRAFAAFAVLVGPTVCMGVTFPLLLREVAGRDDVGYRVGVLMAVNTVGSIIGALFCGYLLLPALGSEQSLRLIGLAFLICALVAGWKSPVRNRSLLIAAGGAALGIAAWLTLPRWDMMAMTNGANVYFEARKPPEALAYVAEDVHGGFTTVEQHGNHFTLYTNGKFQGNNGGEVTAQRSFAHFPSLFVRRHGRALVIGLGTGTTLGTIAAYPYRAVDVVEISPAIVRAARAFFSDINGNALDDPRVRLVQGDGRNHLLIRPERYDLITIELTSVWFAGAANLYSEEFYELCRDRLESDGVLQQWVQLHHIHRREVAVIIRTLRRSFSNVALFVNGGQGILVAANRELVASRAELMALSARPAIAATLGRVTQLSQLLGRLMLSGSELDRFVSESVSPGDDAPLVSTDENLYLEYATPKGNVMGYTPSIQAMFRLLDDYKVTKPYHRHLRD